MKNHFRWIGTSKKNLLENMDCKTPMGIPQTIFKSNKNPSPGIKNNFEISLKFFINPFCDGGSCDFLLVASE